MRSIILILLFSINVVAQNNDNNQKIVNVSYADLLKLKVDENIFEHGWLPNPYLEIPCFRDYRESEIELKIVNPKNNEELTLPKTPEKNSLKIQPYIVTLNLVDSTFTIKGQINGAWKGVTPNEFKIYVGHRADTISDITLSPNLHGDVYYNGKKVTEEIIVNKVPAFYMKDFKSFKSVRDVERLVSFTNDKMVFDITTKIDYNSIIVFGLSSCYAEIFEIGKLFKLNYPLRKKKRN